MPASSINNSSTGNRLIKNVLSGLDLKKSFCRKDNNLFWESGKEKRNCILNDEEDESHIDVKLNIENRPVKNLDMRNKILFYLESHENGNSYSQGISYLQEVREKITSILKNKGLLDEELIDELYNACLIKECSTKEDRKIEGNVIIEVAKKMRDEKKRQRKTLS